MNQLVETMHIHEEENSNRVLVKITVTYEKDNLLSSFDVSKFSGDEQNNYIKSHLSQLRERGVLPSKIYIPVWSKLEPTISQIWPDAKIYIDYRE